MSQQKFKVYPAKQRSQVPNFPVSQGGLGCSTQTQCLRTHQRTVALRETKNIKMPASTHNNRGGCGCAVRCRHSWRKLRKHPPQSVLSRLHRHRRAAMLGLVDEKKKEETAGTLFFNTAARNGWMEIFPQRERCCFGQDFKGPVCETGLDLRFFYIVLKA